MMTFPEFHNALRVLLNLDRVELERFLVLRKGDHPGWARFQENPYRFFIKADTETAKNLFVLMQQRMTSQPVPQEAIDGPAERV